MRRVFIDVDAPFSRGDVNRLGGLNSENITAIIRRMREIATDKVLAVGGALDLTFEPDIVAKEAIHPIIGEVYVFSTRWAAEVPESAQVTPER